jgi:peptidoglycan/xylan/chitin deacetylase (PgdA/CDA1 family)
MVGLAGEWSFGRDNLLRQSNTFSDSVWIKGGYTILSGGGVTTPDGIAASIVRDNVGTTGRRDVTQTITMWATQYKFEVRVKAKEYTGAYIRTDGAGSGNFACFDLSTGSLGTVQTGLVATITSLGDGWYKIGIEFAPAAGNKFVQFGGTTNLTTPTSFGDGTSGIYAAGAQLGESPLENYWGSGVPGTGNGLRSYAATTALTTVTDLNGSADLTLVGAGGLPAQSDSGYTLDGVDDGATGAPEKAAAWTIVNCTFDNCYAVDSDAGSYINGLSEAGAIEIDLTAGAYTGAISYRLQYDRVLTPSEQWRAFYHARTTLRARHLPLWSDKPVASICFDDGNTTDYTIMKPVFDARSVSGTSFAITDNIGVAGLSAAQIAEMSAAGWEFGSHGMSHDTFDTLTAEELEAELSGSKAAIEAITGLTAQNLAYPEGNHNATIDTAVAVYFRSGRGVVAGTNSNPLLPYSLRAYGADDHTAVATREGYVDTAYTANAWIVFFLHSTDADDATAMGTLLDYIAEKPMPILTMNEALDYLRNPLLP